MASKRKLKLRRVSPEYRQAVERVYDRRSADLPINSVVEPVEIRDADNDKIIVFRSLRDDPIAALKARGVVDEAQFAAARHWQRLYERVEISGARAIDFTREAVDGGGATPEPINEERMRATMELRRAGIKLGMEGESIVRDVLGSGMTLLLAAARRNLTTKRELLYLGGRFRECLETLADVFGYKSRARG